MTHRSSLSTHHSSLSTHHSSLSKGSWRDQILKEFTPGVARLILVADPDGLLTEEGILQVLRERGFELISYEDPVAFRFAYESKYRSRLDQGDLVGLVVVVQTPTADLRNLPYDLLQRGRKLSFSLGDLFPNLSYAVVAALDRGELGILYEAQERYNPGILGNNATKDFVLRHVFGVVPELIKEPQDLLRLLLQRHYQGRRVPKVLDERFIQILRNDGRFDDWPLEEIIPNREAFFSFLQERWPIFLDHLAKGTGEYGREAQPVYDLRYSGPLYLPFDHDDVRVYVDNLFVEGHLTPVFHPAGTKLSSRWVAVGLKTDPAAVWRRRFDNLIPVIEKSVPGEGARYKEWLNFARNWAELTVLRFEENFSGDRADVEKFETLRYRVDNSFFTWMRDRYGGLHNQPPAPPVMLHHIPRYLTRALDKGYHQRVALVVLDGLAFDQWLVIRGTFMDCWPNFRFHESAVFAWVPTLTSVSRQALFAGKPPLFFPGSLHTTDKEPLLWTLFWSDQGLEKGAVAYVNVVGDEDLDKVAEALAPPKIRVAGVVVRKVDKIMHGMELGTAGMHNQIRQWAKEGHLAELFNLLLKHEFAVYLTSDHGNIEARGCGVPTEGAVADLRGYRARIYPDRLLRKRIKEKFPDAIEWAPTGLPEDYLPLLAPARSAFIREGEKAVCHGGISLEEVIVPLVCVEQIKGRSL
ncbi:MAG: BREX-3 system phosphatase PglZ [Bacillota bacterium]